MGKIIVNGIEFCGTSDTADNIIYDNKESGLEATTVQGAIDELIGGGFTVADFSDIITEIKTTNATYTATENCYVVGRISGENSSSPLLYIDNTVVASSAATSFFDVYIMLAKGQVLKTRDVGKYELKIYGAKSTGGTNESLSVLAVSEIKVLNHIVFHFE